MNMTDGGRPPSSHDPGDVSDPTSDTTFGDLAPHATGEHVDDEHGDDEHGGDEHGGGEHVGDEHGGDEHGDDEQLLALLGQALTHSDPVPQHVTDAAKAALTWRTIDAELAELVFDSTLEAAGVRAEKMDRQVTFRAPGVEIEAMFLGETTRRLVGQLVPPSELTVELVGSDQVTTRTSDRLGRFTFDDVELGPVRLVVRDADGGPVVQTEWVIF